MNQEILHFLRINRQAMLRDLAGLVAIPSVSVPDQDIPPFGQPLRDALSYMASLASREGWSYRDYDHYIGRIGCNDETKGEEIGMWSHLDVVPVPDPSAWRYPPFELSVVEDRFLIGRGVQDNKMTAIGCLYAMKYIKEQGIPLHRRYALYLGTSEETGMADVQWFTAHHTCPALSLVPDTGFPVCYGMRGNMRIQVSIPFAHPMQIHSSNDPAVSPEKVTVTLPDGTSFSASGVSCHIANAENKPNAVLNMLELLSGLYPDEAQKLHDLSIMTARPDGSGLGIACSDPESGSLQCMPTHLFWENGRLKVILRIVLPFHVMPDTIRTRATQFLSDRAEIAVLSSRPPAAFEKSHPVVRLLTDVYHQVTGIPDEPFVMTGGNYAAWLPNAFGFGPGMPGREFPDHIFLPGHGDFHQCDESDEIDHMFRFIEIYIHALLALDAAETLA